MASCDCRPMERAKMTEGNPYHDALGQFSSADSAVNLPLATSMSEVLKTKIRDDGSTGYEHSERVVNALESPIHKVIGSLHDVVEDSTTTSEDIHAAFGGRVGSAVDALTKRKDESSNAYLRRVTANYDALIVKIADMRDNMMVAPGLENDEHMKKKQAGYAWKFPVLLKALDRYEKAKKEEPPRYSVKKEGSLRPQVEKKSNLPLGDGLCTIDKEGNVSNFDLHDQLMEGVDDTKWRESVLQYAVDSGVSKDLLYLLK